MAGREEKLAKNTIIYAIGSIGSKLVQIVLVPLYTRVMSSAEYGTVDILQAIVQLLVPIVVISIFESVFRYAMEKEYDKIGVLSVGVFITLIGSAVMAILGIGASMFIDPVFVWLVVINTFLTALWTSLSQYTRAIDRTVLFAVNNIFVTLLVLFFNVTFLVVLKWGITGYMLGYALANLFSCIFLMIFLKKDFKISFKNVDKALVKEMLGFSFPLMLNGICWWLSSFTDRVMIVSFIGEAQNGIYSAASKVPHLLSVIVTIFYQAWQMTANQEIKSDDTSAFYSKIYEQNSAFTFMLASALILLSRPINAVFLGPEFSQAWFLMPALIISTTFFSFGQFLIAIYSANKNTKNALITNMICVGCNVVLNAVLIPIIGVLGAAIATALSYVILWFIRIFDTGKIVKIQYNVRNIAISSAVILLQSVLICLDKDVVITYGISAAGFLLLIVMYRKTVVALISFGMNMIKKLIVRKGD